MVVATFSVICTAAVLFLLRFLFALESETRTAQGRKFEMIKIPVYRSQTAGRAVGAAPVLMLVHSNTWRQGATLRPAFMSGSVPCESNSQYKKA
jgi:hypothetical protein